MLGIVIHTPYTQSVMCTIKCVHLEILTDTVLDPTNGDRTTTTRTLKPDSACITKEHKT